MSGSNSLTEISIASHFKRSSVAVSWALHFPLPRSKIQGEMSGSSSFAMKSISLSFKTPSYMWWWFVLSSPLIVLVLDHYLTRRNSFMMRQPCFCVCFLVVAVEYSWHLFWIVIVFRIVSIFWSLLDVSGWSMLSFSYLFYFVVDGSFFSFLVLLITLSIYLLIFFKFRFCSLGFFFHQFYQVNLWWVALYIQTHHLSYVVFRLIFRVCSSLGTFITDCTLRPVLQSNYIPFSVLLVQTLARLFRRKVIWGRLAVQPYSANSRCCAPLMLAK